MRIQLQLLTIAAMFAISFAPSHSAHAAAPVFPMIKGASWTYENNGVKFVERISDIEEVDGEKCAKLETLVNDKPVSYEHIAVRADGLYRVTVAGEKVVPPLCFFKTAETANTKWSVNSKIGDEKIAGDFTSGKTLVAVKAGRFTALAAYAKNFKVQGKDLSFDYFFAPGVGKVKQIVKVDGNEFVLELVEYEIP